MREPIWGALIAAVLALGPAETLAQGDAGDAATDDRIRASAQAAENLQGPLDGSWTLVSASGQALFGLQIVDRPGVRDPLEGVWRDLRHPSLPGDIGPIDTLTRGADSLTIRFAARPGEPPVTVQLKSGADGRWSGELQEGGAVTAVALRRG